MAASQGQEKTRQEETALRKPPSQKNGLVGQNNSFPSDEEEKIVITKVI